MRQPMLIVPGARGQPMRKWFLAVSVVGLLAGSGRSHAQEPRVALPEKPAASWVRAACNRLKGALIALQLRPGMTEEEADRILDNLEFDEVQFSTHRCSMGFRRYGFVVTQTPDECGQWRVTSVRFLPLFAD